MQRTSVVSPRESTHRTVVKPHKRPSGLQSLAPPLSLLPLLLCIPLVLGLWTTFTLHDLLTSEYIIADPVQRVLYTAEKASLLAGESTTFYPDAVFETDWSQHVNASDILHESALHRGCVAHKDSVIPWTFGRPGQDESGERNELVNGDDPQLLEKLSRCPAVDVLVPSGLRNFGYCEDAAAYTKFLESRMLPRWVLDVKFDDPESGRSVSYHDLCPNTPMLFFNHYWDGVPDAADWPAGKPFYLMPNIEMYELESEHYWRADVILCKTALCTRYLRKWFLQEGNPRGTRVLYTRHTTSNLALAAKGTGEAPRKDFSDVSFLHTAGKSIQKGTRQVLDCWLEQPDFPRLDFYMDQELYDGAFNDYNERIRDSDNVFLHTGRLSAAEFGQVVTQGRYFLCPSMMEGYGHYINQARSSNAFIITTDAAPMNELVTPASGALVRASMNAYGEQFMGGKSTKEHALRDVPGLVASFEKEDLCATVHNVLDSSTSTEREQSAHRALQQYYFDTVFFARKMHELRSFAQATTYRSLRSQAPDLPSQ